MHLSMSNVFLHIQGVLLFFKTRAIIELAIPCVKRGPRVFEGFTVGFHPRSWEVVRTL